MNTILKLISSGESEKIEFKQSFDKETTETVVALANTKGGTILIGVKDDRSLCGVEIGSERLQNYANSIKNSTEPALIVGIQVIPVKEKILSLFRLMNSLLNPLAIKANTLNESPIVIIK